MAKLHNEWLICLPARVMPTVWEGIIPTRFDSRKYIVTSRLLTAALLLSAIFSAPVLAAGDPAAGATKGYTCTGCHGIPGYKNTYPMYNVPKLAGQSAEYLVAALSAYKAGERDHSTMNLQAESLTDQDIEDIAVWLESLGESK